MIQQQKFWKMKNFLPLILIHVAWSILSSKRSAKLNEQKFPPWDSFVSKMQIAYFIKEFIACKELSKIYFNGKATIKDALLNKLHPQFWDYDNSN